MADQKLFNLKFPTVGTSGLRKDRWNFYEKKGDVTIKKKITGLTPTKTRYVSKKYDLRKPFKRSIGKIWAAFEARTTSLKYCLTRNCLSGRLNFMIKYWSLESIDQNLLSPYIDGSLLTYGNPKVNSFKMNRK